MKYLFIVTLILGGICFIGMIYALMGLTWTDHLDKKFQRMTRETKWMIEDHDGTKEMQRLIDIMFSAERRCTQDLSIKNPFKWWKRWNIDYVAEAKKIVK